MFDRDIRRSEITANKEEIIIKDFKLKLIVATSALILLSREFERLEADYSDLLAMNYPFNSDLHDVIRKMMEWEEKITENCEVAQYGENTTNC